MRIIFLVILAVLLLATSLICSAQQPVLEVRSFEYTWQGSAYTASHEIIAQDDSAKIHINNSFAKAIKERWNLVLPEVSFSTKPFNFLALKPKFKTTLKDPLPGKWYLFLQIFESGKASDFLNDKDVITTKLELKCKIISGSNDSVILDRNLSVNIQVNAPPPDQVPLTRLPAYPASFVQAFDDIAAWLFQPEPVSNKILRLKPACIFQKTVLQAKPIGNLSFHNDFNGLHQLNSPAFTLKLSSPIYEKVGVKKNVGGRAFAGAFTLLTGVGSTKRKFSKYKADFPFFEKDSSYHCQIGYVEEEMATVERVKDSSGSSSNETSDFSVISRSLDSNFLNVITMDKDTLATFSITVMTESPTIKGYDQMWDGSDSTTIVQLPNKWDNLVPEKDVVITGKIGADHFTMKTCKGNRIKDFYLNDQLASTMTGNFEPVNGLVFIPVSCGQLKLFTILSSIPYSYFSFSRNY
jgi:hypothetical protein